MTHLQTSLPKLFTEREAAELLGLSSATLQRERKRGVIEFTRIGKRKIRYTEDQLRAYIENRASKCRNHDEAISAKLADTGSASGAILPTGAEPGSTPGLDRHVELASALKTLTRQS